MFSLCMRKELPDMARIPSTCPADLREVMLGCFALEPLQRPSFAAVEAMLPAPAGFSSGDILIAVEEGVEGILNAIADKHL